MSRSETQFGDPNTQESAALDYGGLKRLSLRDRVQYVIAYALEHDEPLNLSKIMDLVGGDPTSFSKAFRKETGTTFIDWKRERRIARAKALLAESDLMIISVALECGYEDHTTFCRAFRRAEGISPREFRALTATTLMSRSSRGQDPRHRRRQPR